MDSGGEEQCDTARGVALADQPGDVFLDELPFKSAFGRVTQFAPRLPVENREVLPGETVPRNSGRRNQLEPEVLRVVLDGETEPELVRIAIQRHRRAEDHFGGLLRFPDSDVVLPQPSLVTERRGQVVAPGDFEHGPLRPVECHPQRAFGTAEQRRAADRFDVVPAVADFAVETEFVPVPEAPAGAEIDDVEGSFRVEIELQNPVGRAPLRRAHRPVTADEIRRWLQPEGGPARRAQFRPERYAVDIVPAEHVPLELPHLVAADGDDLVRDQFPRLVPELKGVDEFVAERLRLPLHVGGGRREADLVFGGPVDVEGERIAEAQEVAPVRRDLVGRVAGLLLQPDAGQPFAVELNLVVDNRPRAGEHFAETPEHPPVD